MTAPSPFRPGSGSSDPSRPARQADALQQSEARMRALVERMAFGVFRCTPDGHLADVNPALVTMLGYPDADALRAVDFFTDVLIASDARDLWLEDVARDTMAEWYDLECRRLDGTTIQVRLSVTGERDADGALVVLQGVAENVTERLRKEEIVRRGERMASLGRTLAGVAHEINNPLAAISGFAQILLKRDDGDADLRHAHETILHEARRAARIVKDLLTVARREETADRQRVDLNTVVGYIIGTQRYAMETRGIEPVVDLAPEPAPILGDPAQVEQVVLNLIVNARQALESALERRAIDAGWRPTLRVVTRRVAGTVTLEVSDNGPGIPATDLPHIWDPFWTTRDEGEGSGLGLSVVHSIVASHGGRIDVASVPDASTRFDITFPALPAPDEPPSRALPAPPAPSTGRGPLDVLIVDDELVIREFLSRFLALRGHAVLSAANGDEALRLAEHASFDAVICDLHMPGIDGREVIRRLQARPAYAATRFLLSTGDSIASNTHAASGGMPDVVIVNKPYDVDALVTLVEGT